MTRENERALPKVRFVQGKLNFNSVCWGCGERVNKAIGIYCHECEGGHDVHTNHQAVSLLHHRPNNVQKERIAKGNDTVYEE